MALTAAWLVLALLSAWATTARADDLGTTAPDSGGTGSLGTNAPADTGSTGGGGGPSDATGGGSAGGGGTGGGSTGGGRDVVAQPTDPTAPTDPSGGQPSSTPSADPGAGGTAGTSDPGSAGGTSTPDSSSGSSTTDPPPADPAPSDDSSKKAPSKGSSPAVGATTDGPSAGATAPFAGTQTTLTTGSEPADVMWVDQWAAFQVDTSGGTKPPGGEAGIRLTRSFGLGIFRTTSAKQQLEARAREKGQSPKISSLGGGPLVPGGRGHGLGSFLDLLSGSGGGATLMLFGVLGVLAVTLLPAPNRTRAFRLPVVTWRPSEYVPPIEQPG